MKRDIEKILIVADDLTGANDTGVQFSKKHLKSIVITDKKFISNSLQDFDVLVFDTESRFDDTETAYRKTFEIGKIAKEKNIKYIYKKLDSTFRGNNGAEISAMMDSLEIQHAVIVPALPAYGRVTKDGNVFVNGILLAETETADDPKSPVKESYIPTILSSQTDKSIAVINYIDVISGEQNLILKVQQQINDGIQMIVIDAKEKEDLDMIASVITAIKERILFAGSAGLAEYLPKYFDLKTERKSNIIIAGSVSEATQKQVCYALENMAITLIDVDIEKLFTSEIQEEEKRIIDIIKESSLNGEDIIIRSASSKDLVSRSFVQGQKHGLDRFKVSETIALFLGEIARHVIQEIKINGILFTGGDIAIKAAQSLKITGTIILDEILPGIPYGYYADESCKNIIIASKAGGFGKEDAILQVLTFLRNR